MKIKLKNNAFLVLRTVRQVFRRPQYVALASSAALIVFVFSAWLPNIRLVFDIVRSPLIPIQEKVIIPLQLLGAIQTNFSAWSASYTLAIALLFGMNVALFVYYIKRRKAFFQQSGLATSFGGLVSGILGIGCAACGTLVLAPLLSLVGAGALITLLPFGGQEFGILGVGVLGFSVFLTAKKIQDPLVCKIDVVE